MNHWQVNFCIGLRPTESSLWPVKFISFNIIWHRENLYVYIYLVWPQRHGHLSTLLTSSWLASFVLCSFLHFFPCFKCWLLAGIYVYCTVALARNYHKLHCHYSSSTSSRKNNEKMLQNGTINMKILLFSLIAAYFGSFFGSWQFIAGSTQFIFSSL